MKPNRRFNWLVNKKLQEGLSRRMLVYWCGTWLAIFAVPVLARMIQSKLSASALAMELVSDMWFPMVMSLMVLPIVFWDIHRMSHRIAGPIKRISNDMERFTNGESVAEIKLRDNDFCQDLAGNFNRLMQQHAADARAEEPETVGV